MRKYLKDSKVKEQREKTMIVSRLRTVQSKKITHKYDMLISRNCKKPVDEGRKLRQEISSERSVYFCGRSKNFGFMFERWPA